MPNDVPFDYKDPFAVLLKLREDAHKALSGEWDRSDRGFQDQLVLIATCMGANNRPLPRVERRTKHGPR